MADHQGKGQLDESADRLRGAFMTAAQAHDRAAEALGRAGWPDGAERERVAAASARRKADNA